MASVSKYYTNIPNLPVIDYTEGTTFDRWWLTRSNYAEII